MQTKNFIEFLFKMLTSLEYVIFAALLFYYKILFKNRNTFFCLLLVNS